MKHTIKSVIFDLDGTLVDAYKAVAGSLNHTLTRMGCAPLDDETIRRTVGWGDRHLVGTFVNANELDKAMVMYRHHHADALKEGTVFLPGARELLETLKAQGLKLAVASNRPARFTRIVLEHLRVSEIFDCVLCGDQVACPKPAADMLEQILAQFALTPDEALYIGDMTIDIEAGNKACIKTVIVLTGSSTESEVTGLGPFKVIDHISQANDIIEELNA